MYCTCVYSLLNISFVHKAKSLCDMGIIYYLLFWCPDLLSKITLVKMGIAAWRENFMSMTTAASVCVKEMSFFHTRVRMLITKQLIQFQVAYISVMGLFITFLKYSFSLVRGTRLKILPKLAI